MTSASGRMSMEEFANHDPGTRAEREYLAWKNDKEGKVEVWLLDDPWKVWRHTWQRVLTVKKDGKEKEICGMFVWNTMETEETVLKLRKQGYYYDDDRELEDRREPKCDPFLKMLEWTYRAVREGAIDWLDPVFKFEPKDEQDRIIHAGGLLKMFPSSFDDLSFANEAEERAVKNAFKAANVDLKNVFKEAGTIGLKYVFTVLEDEHPSNGPKVAIESEALGNAIKKIYEHRKEKFEDGKRTKEEIQKMANLVKRVCLRWKFDNSKNFSEKYDVIELDNRTPSEEVRQAFEADLPDVEIIIGQGNVAQLEQNFRQHWCHDVSPPWQKIFADAYERARELEKEHKRKPGTYTELSTDFNHGANEKESPKSAPEVGSQTDGDTVPCEACGKHMPADATACPHCKAEYVEVKDQNGDVFVCLKKQKCQHCGESWNADELKCGACGAEYQAGEDGFVVTKKPEPKSQVPEARTSRRRLAAK